MMDGVTFGFVSIGVLVTSNIIIVAYTYGKLQQSVKDLGRRVSRIEGLQNHNPGKKR